MRRLPNWLGRLAPTRDESSALLGRVGLTRGESSFLLGRLTRDVRDRRTALGRFIAGVGDRPISQGRSDVEGRNRRGARQRQGISVRNLENNGEAVILSGNAIREAGWPAPSWRWIPATLRGQRRLSRRGLLQLCCRHLPEQLAAIARRSRCLFGVAARRRAPAIRCAQGHRETASQRVVSWA